MNLRFCAFYLCAAGVNSANLKLNLKRGDQHVSSTLSMNNKIFMQIRARLLDSLETFVGVLIYLLSKKMRSFTVVCEK